jgi:hypothetical protein
LNRVHLRPVAIASIDGGIRELKVDSWRQPPGLRSAKIELGRAKLQLALLTVVCFVAFVYAAGFIALRSVHAAVLPGVAGDPGQTLDGLGVTYASRLNDGTSASAQTRLFDLPGDRQAQIEALKEDDAYTRDASGNVVSFAENKMLFSVCAPSAELAPAVQSNGRNGYILHLALRGDATPEEQAKAIDRYGARWATIFARYHPLNNHCALVILSSDVTAEDEAENDDAGDAILNRKCFTAGPAALARTSP